MEPPRMRAAREFPVEETTLSAWWDVFAIFSVEDRPEGMRVVACEGTGFRLGRSLFVTCWHCAANENHRYMLSRGEVDPGSGGAVLYPLHDVAQDANGLQRIRMADDLVRRDVAERLESSRQSGRLGSSGEPTTSTWCGHRRMARPQGRGRAGQVPAADGSLSGL